MCSKSMLLLLFLLAASMQGYTQEKYSDIKNKYAISQYETRKGDPYSPAKLSLSSFIIPGLGQTIMKEKKSGLIFLGTFATGVTMIILGSQNYPRGNTSVQFNALGVNGQNPYDIPPLIGFGVMVTLGTQIISCVHASKMAKIKNLVFRESTVLNRLKIRPNLLNTQQGWALGFQMHLPLSQ